MKRTFYYEAYDVTPGKVKFRQRTKRNAKGGATGDTTVNTAKEAELGYILYMNKGVHNELGQPQVLKLTIEVATEADDPFPI